MEMGDEEWLAPDHAACASFVRRTRGQITFMQWLVIALLFDLCILPVIFWVVVMTLRPNFTVIPFWAIVGTLALSGFAAPFAVLVIWWFSKKGIYRR